MSQYLKDKIVWITGASTGIGEACTREFVKRGARVAVSARSEEKLLQLENEFGSERVKAFPLDVTDKEANRRAVAGIEEHFGSLDIAFLNAGTWQEMDLEEFNSETFEKHIQVNFLGMIYGIEAALPALYRSKAPHLVGMSSVVAYRGIPRAEAYCASKSAIRSALQALRVQLLKKNVPVTIVCPGFVKSPLTDKNEFEMPFIMEPTDAVRRIADGLEKQKHEIAFPLRFVLMWGLIASLPSRLYTRIMKRMATRS